jgi:DNA-3-methyladenine glycosylase I
MDKTRCSWCQSSELMMDYHDKEWGTPLHDDRKLFEALTIDGFQAGLSWSTILNKRENFRKAFDNFNVEKVAAYTLADFNRLMKDAGIVRNRLKIASTITNAQAFIAIQKEFGSFDKYLWSFVSNKPIVNKHKLDSDIGATSKESDALSKDLKKRGFRFVGSTIVYAFMQGVGMVNDHLISCFRYNELKKLQ